jgi:hypothetical protein
MSMAKLLSDICYVRSGDKGNVCTAGLIAKTPADYPALLASVTPDKVRALYGEWITGEVECYPMDNIEARRPGRRRHQHAAPGPDRQVVRARAAAAAGRRGRLSRAGCRPLLRFYLPAKACGFIDRR